MHLKCDVLLLADVFGKFINNKLKNYGLCPSRYLSAPALSWDALANMTKNQLEIITDLDMYISFEKGMRGGVSYIFNRYSEANNKYLKSYNQKQFISLDANNSYGYAISRFLPPSQFKWMDLKDFDLNKYTSNSLIGCVLEVDLECTK